MLTDAWIDSFIVELCKLHPEVIDWPSHEIPEVAEACAKIASNGIAEQAKGYERVIASLEKEIARLNESNAAYVKMLNAITESNLQRIRAHI